MVDGEIVDSAEDEASTNEVEEVQEDQSESEVETSGEAEEGQSEPEAEDTDGSEDDQPEDSEVIETVKVEYDGDEFEVPAKIKDALMRDQDYTHKTQALAETRKAFEQEQNDFRQYVEVSKAHSDQMAHLAAMDQQLQQFEQYDWNAAFDADITAATKLQHQVQQLGAARANLVEQLQGAEQERERLQQKNMARTAERTEQALKQKIPNWGEEAKTELGKFAVEVAGFPADAVSKAVTEAEIMTLYYANIGYKTLQKVKASEAKAVAPKKVIKPSKNIKPKRQSAPTDLSKISDPEAYRAARLAKQRKIRA